MPSRKRGKINIYPMSDKGTRIATNIYNPEMRELLEGEGAEFAEILEDETGEDDIVLQKPEILKCFTEGNTSAVTKLLPSGEEVKDEELTKRLRERIDNKISRRVQERNLDDEEER